MVWLVSQNSGGEDEALHKPLLLQRSGLGDAACVDQGGRQDQLRVQGVGVQRPQAGSLQIHPTLRQGVEAPVSSQPYLGRTKQYPIFD